MGLDWHHFVVAIDRHERVIGCGQIKVHRGGARELASLVTAPEWRGLGVGGAIVRWLMDDAGPPLWLMCRSDLAGFYLKFGFREVGGEEPKPRYFRRMRALARVFLFARRNEYLAIMVWRG
jgi:amino-acid N-acetyltransferase